MSALVAWVGLLIYGIWTFFRVGVHRKLLEAWPTERYDLFRLLDEVVGRIWLTVCAVLFCYYWIVSDSPYYTPDVVTFWVTMMVITVGHLHYPRLYHRLWAAIKEPFRPVDRRDLKYRVKVHFTYARLDLAHCYPRTWGVIHWVIRLFKRKGSAV